MLLHQMLINARINTQGFCLFSVPPEIIILMNILCFVNNACANTFWHNFSFETSLHCCLLNFYWKRFHFKVGSLKCFVTHRSECLIDSIAFDKLRIVFPLSGSIRLPWQLKCYQNWVLIWCDSKAASGMSSFTHRDISMTTFNQQLNVLNSSAEMIWNFSCNATPVAFQSTSRHALRLIKAFFVISHFLLFLPDRWNVLGLRFTWICLLRSRQTTFYGSFGIMLYSTQMSWTARTRWVIW